MSDAALGRHWAYCSEQKPATTPDFMELTSMGVIDT